MAKRRMTVHPLDCGHVHVAEARVPEDPSPENATSNVTDLRRARQRARGTISRILDDILAWMAAQNIQRELRNPARVRQTNAAITEIASQRMREELVSWLSDRHRTTIGRAARAAFDSMQSELPVQVDRDRFRDQPRYTSRDSDIVRQIRQVDAGLLYDTELARSLGLNEPLAQELGDDVTRQLRQGVQQDESVQELADRVRFVINEGDSPERREKGVTGQTKRSKAELIAHDSVQDAYNSSARKRYLRNGFRYVVFDATIDTKTTQICRRMNEWVIDLRETPFLIPPLHPYCRSGIRPILDIGDRTVLSEDDIADSFLQTIFQTKSYRPPVVDENEFRPTPLSEQFGHTA